MHLLCRNVAVIKSNRDTRYGLDSIVTHDGVKLPCVALPSLSLFRQKFGFDAYEQVSECQNIIYMSRKKTIFNACIQVIDS